MCKNTVRAIREVVFLRKRLQDEHIIKIEIAVRRKVIGVNVIFGDV